ncbi:hypothetical protein [Paraburkholderia sp. 35.1]|uniref:hypothetical protein n=1 Tax=Paraburkholderia sp. 35.1 TaxID=2991058 RepID=UPI003D218F94
MASTGNDNFGTAEETAARDKFVEAKILAAIEESKYTWRTAEGISKEVNYPEQQVEEILNRSEQFIKAIRSNQHGQPLYSTREKYEADAGIRERLLSVITNKLGG